MTEHTPGPWERGTGSSSCYIQASDADGRAITLLEIFIGSVGLEAARANGRLAAAAPELLASCELALEALVSDPLFDSTTNTSTIARETLEIAIAKAKGA